MAKSFVSNLIKKGRIKMKIIIKDILFGFLVVIVITLCEFIVTIPFGLPDINNKAEYIAFMNQEFLLTVLPALFVTYGFAWILKTKTMKEAMQKSIIWTLLVLLNFVMIGLGNDNISEIFKTFGIFVLLIGTFIGPILYVRLNTKKI